MKVLEFKYNDAVHYYIEGNDYLRQHSPYTNAVEQQSLFTNPRMLNELLTSANAGSLTHIPAVPQGTTVSLDGNTFVFNPALDSDMLNVASQATTPRTDTQSTAAIQQKVTGSGSVKDVQHTGSRVKETLSYTFGAKLPDCGKFSVFSGGAVKGQEHTDVQSFFDSMSSDDVDRMLQLCLTARSEQLTKFKETNQLILRIKKLEGELSDSSARVRELEAEKSKLVQEMKPVDEVSGRELVSAAKAAPKQYDSRLENVPHELIVNCKAYCVEPVDITGDIKTLLKKAINFEWTHWDGWYAVDSMAEKCRVFLNSNDNTVFKVPIDEVMGMPR